MWINIVADAHIPFVENAFANWGNLILLPGQDIDNRALQNCDALLVRSITHVDEALLQNTPVKFVGSATAGTDHIAPAVIHDPEIFVGNAHGGNAESVVEYVLAAIDQVLFSRHVPLRGLTLGVIGCGEVGRRLGLRCEALGMTVLRNDPPLDRKLLAEGKHSPFISLEAILRQADLVSLHVPRTYDGPDVTIDLIGRNELELMKPSSTLINTSRGGVVNETALKKTLTAGGIAGAVVDVWQAEPEIDCDLLRLVDIGTPHIAGYSIDAKMNCTTMIAEQFSSYFSCGKVPSIDINEDSFELNLPCEQEKRTQEQLVRSAIKQMYPIQDDGNRLLSACLSTDSFADAFRKQRQQYPRRYTFSRYGMRDSGLPEELLTSIRSGLGIRVL